MPNQAKRSRSDSNAANGRTSLSTKPLSVTAAGIGAGHAGLNAVKAIPLADTDSQRERLRRYGVSATETWDIAVEVSVAEPQIWTRIEQSEGQYQC
jgi:hypothetical protein